MLRAQPGEFLLDSHFEHALVQKAGDPSEHGAVEKLLADVGLVRANRGTAPVVREASVAVDALAFRAPPMCPRD